MSENVNYREVGQFHVLNAPRNPIGAFDAERFKNISMTLITQGTRHLILDLSELDFLYSDAFNAFMVIQGEFNLCQGSFGMITNDETVLHTLNTAGISNKMPIYANETDLPIDKNIVPNSVENQVNDAISSFRENDTSKLAESFEKAVDLAPKETSMPEIEVPEAKTPEVEAPKEILVSEVKAPEVKAPVSSPKEKEEIPVENLVQEDLLAKITEETKEVPTQESKNRRYHEDDSAYTHNTGKFTALSNNTIDLQGLGLDGDFDDNEDESNKLGMVLVILFVILLIGGGIYYINQIY